MQASQMFGAIFILACGLLVVQAQQYDPAQQYQSEQEYYNAIYRQYYQTQTSDDTHFRDYYTQLPQYRPSQYASHNYFNQPATPTDYNYYIVPSESNAYSLDGTLDSQLPETRGNHL